MGNRRDGSPDHFQDRQSKMETSHRARFSVRRFTPDEFQALEQALEAIPIHGHRGFVEVEGGSMADWGKKK